MPDGRFDLLVVGGGPGGYAAALYGASAGLRVALVEMAKVGGTCLHVGCIPAKHLLETAAAARHVRGAAEYGVTTGPVGFDASVASRSRRSVTGKLFEGLSRLLKGRRVEVLSGRGRLLATGEVAVETGEETVLVAGDSLILAPGSLPRNLEGMEPDGRVVVTSDEFFDLEEYPDRVVVVGGGVIGCEFASALCDLGVEVVILEAMERILPGVDGDVVRILERSLRRRGVEIHTGVKISDVARDRSSVIVEWQEGGRCVAGLAVVAVGRRPRTETLDLAGSGVELDERGFIRVDGRCRTTRPRTWAVGDAVATPQLAHVAFAEGILAVRDAMGEEPAPLDYDRVPWCIYTHPEVAFVGLNEQQARERGIPVTTVTQHYAGNGRALMIGEPEGLVKLVARVDDEASPVLVGVHMVGPWVTEQLSGPYLSVNWEASADDLAGLIQPHPTLGEAFGEAAIALTGRRLH